MTLEAPLEDAAPLRRCLNCGAELAGRYCAHCGQAADVHVPSTRELAHEALEGITHSDSRLWRTLFLLWFVPGKLTQEFVAGRRAAYLPPFRLYLVLSIMFFLAASVSNPQVKFVRLDNMADVAAAAPADCASVIATSFTARLFGPGWTPRIERACGEITRDNGANLLHVFLGTAPKAMFIFLPLIAFFHMLMYWRPRQKYAVHLLFFLYAHAFFFSLMTLVIVSVSAAAAWPRLAPVLDLAPLLLWSLPIYTVLAMRRVFGRSWASTLLKASALCLVYVVVLCITVTGVFVYAALQL